MTFFRAVITTVFVLMVVVESARAAEPLKTLAAGPVIPVLAWGGVPYTQATPERFAELAGAGFTHNYSGAPDAATMLKVLDISHAAGIKQFIAIPELQRDPEGTARQFKDHPGVGGYYLRDEPGADLFGELAKWATRIQSVDTKNPCYVNLLPTYGNAGMWGTPNYSTYVDRFVAEVPVPMVSFDHYSIIGKDDNEAGHIQRTDYYQNLELCAAAARKANRPLWAFALATAHNPYPIPTVAALRLQMFSNLAYGAQALQYFTYWTTHSEVWNFHEGPLDADGKRTPTYERVRQVNAEVQALRGAFLGSKVLSIGHTGQAIPAGTTQYTPVAPVKSFETTGPGAVVSLVAKGDRRFLVVVNRDLHAPMPLRVSFDPAAGVQAIAKDGSVQPPLADAGAHATDIEAGDIAIFTWEMR